MMLPEELRRPIILKAFEFAKKTHAGQKRDNGDEYIVHPYRVCLSLHDEFEIGDEDILAAALLHDVMEDSDTGRRELAASFNEKVAEMVDKVTKRKDPDDPLWEQRYYENLRKADRGTQLIKFADRLDNLRDLPTCPSKEKRMRYLEETREVYLGWAEGFDEGIYNKLKEEIRKAEALI